MKVFSQLEKAQLENVTADPSLTLNGLITCRTDLGMAKIYAGAAWRTLADLNTAQTFSNKSIDADANTITNIENADIKSGAAIARNKLATGTAYGVVTNDASGVMTSVAPGTSGNVLKSDGTQWTSGTFTQANLAVTSKTSGYTATGSDDVIICNASGGAFTITLPAAASNTGKMLKIIKTGSDFNAITIDGNASETIDGTTTVQISLPGDSIDIVCDGSNWQYCGPHYESFYTASPTITNAGTSPSGHVRGTRNGRDICVTASLTTGATGTPNSPNFTSTVIPTNFQTQGTTGSTPEFDAATSTTYSAQTGVSGTISFSRLNSSYVQQNWPNATTKLFHFAYVKTN